MYKNFTSPSVYAKYTRMYLISLKSGEYLVVSCMYIHIIYYSFSALSMQVSPPARKPIIEKSENFDEIIPRLILAAFSIPAEVKFGEVIVNSSQSKPLVIFNPSASMTVKMSFRYGLKIGSTVICTSCLRDHAGR